MIVQFVILLRRGFIHAKILEWNVNKSASRLYVYAPKVDRGVVPPSVIFLLLMCEH
jgi:hypothetical protein